MIISRTPYRISFFGGGTDYHTWYQEHGAAVLATTINRYCYLHCRRLAPFFQHKSRVVWSIVEDVLDNHDIQHPSAKAVLDYLKIDSGLEIHHLGDLPARSGLGSSSAFTVGLLNALYSMNGVMSSKHELACEAIHVERDVLKELVGVQDQIETSYGGLNKITIQPSGNFEVIPMILPPDRIQALQDHLLLFYTGVARNASDIAAEQIKSIPNKKAELFAIRQMVDEGVKILSSNSNLNDFGRLLHESWKLKRQIATGISPEFVDAIYSAALEAGALGGKLLGAGGGGFILFFVEPDLQKQVCAALDKLLLVPFKFENSGSQIIFYENNDYSHTSMERRDYLHLNDVQVDDELLHLRQRLNHLIKQSDEE